jgi:AraC-like DNA-binding protein
MKSTRRPRTRSTAEPDFFSAQVSAARRFYLDLKPRPDDALVVVCGGLEHCTPDYRIQRSTFPFFGLEYVIRGRGNLKLQSRTHELQPGRVFAYGPGIRQEINGDPAAPLVKFFVDFTGTRAVELLRTCRLKPGGATQVFPAHELQPLFEELIRSGVAGAPRSPELCARLLECLALKLASSRAPAQGAETMAFATWQHCRAHIQQHFKRLRTLEQVGAECHVNAAYLCRLFRRFDHQSPYQHLLRLKLNHAAELLHEPGALVKQVAEQVGFADAFHFSRAFKGVFGLAPDAFRKLR